MTFLMSHLQMFLNCSHLFLTFPRPERSQNPSDGEWLDLKTQTQDSEISGFPRFGIPKPKNGSCRHRGAD